MPPKPAPPQRSGRVDTYKALYDYKGQQSDELSFSQGDIIYVTDKTDPQWWKAQCNGKSGLVPFNYFTAENAMPFDAPVHEAAKRGNIPLLSECLAANCGVNGLDKAGSTPLHWAASGGHDVCVEMLLKVPNIALNVQNKLGDTPLHGAAWKNRTEIVRMLLAKGADSTLVNNEGSRPYDLARDPDVGAQLQVFVNSSCADYGDDDEYNSD